MRARRPRCEIAEEIRDNLRPWRHAVSIEEIDRDLATFASMWAKRPRVPSAATIRRKARQHIAKVERIRADIFFMPESVTAPLFGWLTKIADGGVTGPPPRFNAIGNFCAECALGMVRNRSRKKPTNTKGGQIQVVAALIHEALSGHRRDLRRSCEAVVTSYKPFL
jgi:hypothetical protein